MGSYLTVNCNFCSVKRLQCAICQLTLYEAIAFHTNVSKYYNNRLHRMDRHTNPYGI